MISCWKPCLIEKAWQLSSILRNRCETGKQNAFLACRLRRTAKTTLFRRHIPQMIRRHLQSGRFGFTLVHVMLILLVFIGLASGLFICSVIRDREQSHARSCSMNLGKIQAAKAQITNSRTVITMNDIVRYTKAQPTCPSGGVYAIGDLHTVPTCSKSTSSYPHNISAAP